MTSTTSSNNLAKEFKSIYRWSFKKRFGLTALFSGLMFMALPMILILALNNASSSNAARQMQGIAPLTDLNDVFQGCTQLVVPLLVVPLSLLFALILATMLYSYMHQKRSVDLFHAAPVGRTPMLLGKLVFGVTLLAIPLVLNFGITAVVAVFYQLDPGQYLPYLLRTFAWVLFMSVASFAFATVMAVCSGTTFDMVISTVVINITYPLLIVLSLVTAQRILPGMPLNISLGSASTTALAPFVAAFIPVLPENAFGELGTPGIGFLLWWIFLTAALIVGAVYLYKNRKSECAESHFAFPLPKIFIRFIATGAAGLAFALVFLMALDDSDFSFFIGLLTGSLAAHIVAEAVYGRGFKGLKKSFAYYGVFLAAFAVFYGILATGFFGYDTRIPAAPEVESVEFNTGGLLNDHSVYYNFDGFSIMDEDYDQVAYVKSALKEPDSIAKAVAYHKGMTECYRAAGYPYRIKPGSGPQTSLVYHLKNGRIVERKYFYSDLAQELTDDSLKNRQSELTLALVNTGEYRTSGNALYYLEPQFVKSITFYRNNSAENTVIVPDREATAELIDALRTDWENHQFSETWLDSDTTATEKADPNTYTNLNFDIQPARPNENGPLKAAVGDFDGKIRFDVGSYMLSEAFPNTKKLVEEKGWLK